MENGKSAELSMSWRQLAEHNKEGDAWLAIRGQVYDVTSWVNAHPGGKDTILLNAVRHLSSSLSRHLSRSFNITTNCRSNFAPRAQIQC
jgi:predicted heme/steroid binding protein